uniref:Uncharacterized protein n=1 Tax=Anguilla anguilla TaxID=7936 RepID=A0A0E9VFK0_ANGAN
MYKFTLNKKKSIAMDSFWHHSVMPKLNELSDFYKVNHVIHQLCSFSRTIGLLVFPFECDPYF